MSIFSRKFTFYVLSCDLYPGVVLCISAKKKHCEEFYHKFLKDKHVITFKNWCDDMHLEYQTEAAWEKYYRAKISSAESGQYKVAKVSFSHEELAALMRAFSATPYLNCTFETDFDLLLRVAQENSYGAE